MAKHKNILHNTFLLSALLALAVTLVMNLCFMLFMAYGDYISGQENDSMAGDVRQEQMLPSGFDGKHPRHEMPPREHRDFKTHHAQPYSQRQSSCKREQPSFDAQPNSQSQSFERPPKPGLIPPHFWMNLLTTLLATYLLFVVSLKILHAKCLKQWKRNLLVLVITLVWIFLYGYLFSMATAHEDPDIHMKERMMRGMMTVSAFYGTLVYFSSLLVFYVNRWHETAIENEALRALNYSTQYEALKSKLDPHFLFNALNTLSSLIAVNSTQAEVYLQKLSTIFRTTLNHKDVESVGDEIEFAHAYSDLMTIRYDSSLSVMYEVPEDLKTCRIVSFGIQTLIENAIKHNTITTKRPLTVHIGAEQGYVTVSNAKQPKKEVEKGSGLGLKLLSERCMALFDRDIVIEDDEQTFTVKIPIAE